MQGSYIGYYSSFPSFGGGFDSRTLLQKKDHICLPDKCGLFSNQVRRSAREVMLTHREVANTVKFLRKWVAHLTSQNLENYHILRYNQLDKLEFDGEICAASLASPSGRGAPVANRGGEGVFPSQSKIKDF